MGEGEETLKWTRDHITEQAGNEEFDRMVDDIICSKDFEDCTYRSPESDCEHPVEVARLLQTGLWMSRCWYVKKCPAGYSRQP